jgi:hypothetical protein
MDAYDRSLTTPRPDGPTPMATQTATRTSPSRAGALAEIFIGVLWLATSAWVAHASYAGEEVGLTGALEDAVGSLPSTVAATIFTSAAIASAVAGRFPAAITRLLGGLGAGTVFGLLAALGIRFGYGSEPAITVLALVVGAAGILGGAVAALPGPVVEAALWATTWVLFFGVIFGVLAPQMTDLFGGGPDASEQARLAAQGRVALVQSLATGIIGAIQATTVLRRDRPAWAWCPFACALPGVVLLAAEGLTRIGGTRLAEVLPGGPSVVALDDGARLRHALIVLIAGAVLGAVLARRSQPDFD